MHDHEFPLKIRDRTSVTLVFTTEYRGGARRSAMLP